MVTVHICGHLRVFVYYVLSTLVDTSRVRVLGFVHFSGHRYFCLNIRKFWGEKYVQCTYFSMRVGQIAFGCVAKIPIYKNFIIKNNCGGTELLVVI